MGMNIAEELKKLDLPYDSFVVVGSGILGALNIRESADIDLIVSQEVYDRLELEGWDHGKWDEQVVLKKDLFDVGRIWFGDPVDALIKKAQYIDGIPYLSLDDVFAWKKVAGREKDLRDLMLISAYRENLSI